MIDRPICNEGVPLNLPPGVASLDSAPFPHQGLLGAFWLRARGPVSSARLRSANEKRLSALEREIERMIAGTRIHKAAVRPKNSTVSGPTGASSVAARRYSLGPDQYRGRKGFLPFELSGVAGRINFDLWEWPEDGSSRPLVRRLERGSLDASLRDISNGAWHAELRADGHGDDAPVLATTKDGSLVVTLDDLDIRYRARLRDTPAARLWLETSRRRHISASIGSLVTKSTAGWECGRSLERVTEATLDHISVGGFEPKCRLASGSIKWD